MKDNRIVSEVINIIGNVISVNNPDKSLTSIDIETNLSECMTSIDFVRMIVGLEEKFNIEIPDKYLVSDNLNSIEEIENIILVLLKEKASGDLI